MRAFSFLIPGRSHRHRTLGTLAAASLGLLAAGLPDKAGAAVVRLAPDFQWIGVGGKTHPLKQFRGQPVVLVIAPSLESKAYRQQVEKFEKQYLDLSSRKTVFAAALTAQANTLALEGNVPFVTARDGAAVAAAYGVTGDGFAVVVIGPDGNVDMQSDRVEPAQRVLDIINNSFQPQAEARKDQDAAKAPSTAAAEATPKPGRRHRRRSNAQ